MKLKYSGRKMEITEPIKTYIDKRLKKIPKLFIEPIDIHVILSVQKHRHVAEIVMTTKLFNATSIEESNDMYVSINKAIEKLERQGIKLRDKVIGSKQRHLSVRTSEAPVTKPPVAAKKAVPVTKREEVVEVKSKTRVVAENIKRRKSLGLEEALLALEATEKDFLVYRDADTDSVQVVYNRKDGKVGLVRTE